ncbi:MAG TPA: ACT domain-containing protein [Candidatus Polarisedimenticolia bacterium]|nr:ACT domain-containing protein [Candidatus Polarisedimenticolia bacterium]
MPRHHFILTAIGRDRPGIVADLAEMVFDLGCNLEDSSMMNLGSEFATMVLISGPGADLGPRLHMACKHLEYEKGMTIFIKPIEEGAGPASPPAGKPYRLHTMGEDKAGIVARTARAVSGAGGNILQLTSHLRPAASSGTPLYEMEMRFDLPVAANLEALRKKLADIENALHVDITLTPV